jgi:hypothetical protein
VKRLSIARFDGVYATDIRELFHSKAGVCIIKNIELNLVTKHLHLTAAKKRKEIVRESGPPLCVVVAHSGNRPKVGTQFLAITQAVIDWVGLHICRSVSEMQ